MARQGVLAYNGEKGTDKYFGWHIHNGDYDLFGYKKADGKVFSVNHHYTDPDSGDTVLYYEGHTGYDFPYSHNYEVVAAAAGRLYKLGDDYNTIRIDHDSGYSTYYLHMLPADTNALSEWCYG